MSEFLHELEFIYKYVLCNSKYLNIRSKTEALVLLKKCNKKDTFVIFFGLLYLSAIHRICVVSLTINIDLAI